jgi:hypothetical protein
MAKQLLRLFIMSILSIGLMSCSSLKKLKDETRGTAASQSDTGCSSILLPFLDAPIRNLPLGKQILTGSSGIQIDAKLAKIHKNSKGEIIYINTRGPTRIKYNGRQVPKQGVKEHPYGFGSPVGKIKGPYESLEDLTNKQLKEIDLVIGDRVELNYISGIKVEGRLSKVKRRNGKIIMIIFDDDVTVLAPDGSTLFKSRTIEEPFDMMIMNRIIHTSGIQ